MFFPGKVLYLNLLKQRTEAVAERCPVKMMLSEISQNSQENNCARVSFLTMLQAKANNFIKEETDTDVFPSVLRNFKEQLFLQKISGGCF